MRVPNPESAQTACPEPSSADARYEPPSFELICLACEISAYAPDDGLPLF